MFDWQLAVVCVLVAAALIYVGRQTWRTWTGRGGGCGGKCGCSKSNDDRLAKQTPIIPAEELMVRLRK